MPCSNDINHLCLQTSCLFKLFYIPRNCKLQEPQKALKLLSKCPYIEISVYQVLQLNSHSSISVNVLASQEAPRYMYEYVTNN